VRSVRSGEEHDPDDAAPRVPDLDAPLDRVDAGVDESYVDNAGLVVLWPFLGHLFEHLELLAERQFPDRAALHRAVGLLQHLATGDREPPEYQLALPKVLCGMDLDEALDFGPPVTETETEECENLLTAAIAHAPILGEMSIAGLRESFLLRKGVLSARDGAWLLRVERVGYDVVLDRLPWGVGWVKLGWMEAALRVEW
jgi:Contractile injection system tape measure protein